MENKRNKETALLDSAFDLFTKKDIHSVTVQDIVKKANVAKGTFYLYFKDKYQIRDVLIQKEAARLFQEAREKLETIIIRFCKSYGFSRPRMYRKQARKNYLALAKAKKRSTKKIRATIRKQRARIWS